MIIILYHIVLFENGLQLYYHFQHKKRLTDFQTMQAKKISPNEDKGNNKCFLLFSLSISPTFLVLNNVMHNMALQFGERRREAERENRSKRTDNKCSQLIKQEQKVFKEWTERKNILFYDQANLSLEGVSFIFTTDIHQRKQENKSRIKTNKKVQVNGSVVVIKLVFESKIKPNC